MQRVRCASGLEGWRAKLRENYGNFAEFAAYDATYSLASRLGYESAEEAWDDNPTIEGSTKPSDFRKVVGEYAVCDLGGRQCPE